MAVHFVREGHLACQIMLAIRQIGESIFVLPQMLRYVTSLQKEAFFSTWENIAAGQNYVW